MTAVECTGGEVNEAMECGNTDDGLGEMDTAGPAELADVVEDFSGNIQEYVVFLLLFWLELVEFTVSVSPEEEIFVIDID